MANRQVFPSSIFPLRGDISAETGATSVIVQGIQGIPVISPPVEPAGLDTFFYDSYNNDWFYASPWDIPVGTPLVWEGYGYGSSGISWIAPDTLAFGNGTDGDVSGAAAMTALVLFGSASYYGPYNDYEVDYGPSYDQFYTSIFSGATQNWNLILPPNPGTSGQVLTTNGTGVSYWSTVSGGGGNAWATLTGDLTETQIIPWDGGILGIKDTGISRLGAASLAIGNGTAGDFSGSLTLGTLTQRSPYANAGFIEDFLFANSVTASGIVLLACDTGWAVGPFGGGTTGIAAPQAGTFANPGQLRLTTTAVSGQGLYLWKSSMGTGGSAESLGNLFAKAGWDSEFIVSISATTNICIRVGFCEATIANTDPPTDWFGVEYDTANTGNTNTDFTWTTNTASSPTYSIVNAKAADTNFHRFRFRSLVAGTILMSVDGGIETPVTTATNNAVGIFLQVIPRTGTSIRLIVDYVSYVAATGRI